MNEIKNGGICSTLHSNRKYFICAKIVRTMRNTINSPTHCNGRSETTELIYSKCIYRSSMNMNLPLENCKYIWK